MDDAVPELDIRIYDSVGLHEQRDEVLAVYTEVYADQLDDPFYSLPRYWERLVAYASREGFAFATGRLDGELVCYALGYPLRLTNPPKCNPRRALGSAAVQGKVMTARLLVL